MSANGQLASIEPNLRTMWPLQSPILLIYLSGVYSLKLHIEEFYSKSFVPEDIHLAYDIVGFEKINFNLTVEVPFPGKLLMHIFARKLSDQVGGSDQVDLVRFKNMDLCKLLDSLRNITVEEIPGESLLPSTFVVSCPLVPGFYYIKESSVDLKLVPFRIPDGRYMVLIELIQVYEEVMKLATARIKFAVRRPPGYKEPSSDFDSNDEEGVTKNREKEKKEPNDVEGEKKGPNNEEKEERSSEVSDPSENNNEAGKKKELCSEESSDDNHRTSTDYE